MKTKKLAAPIIKQAVFIIFLLFFLVPAKVVAHATLVKSDPPRRASLSEAPKSVQLWFNEEIEGSYASISVLDSDDNSITDEKPESVPEDLKSVVLALPEIGPGSYTVNYRVLSVDGHVVESNYNFRVKNISQ